MFNKLAKPEDLPGLAKVPLNRLKGGYRLGRPVCLEVVPSQESGDILNGTEDLVASGWRESELLVESTKGVEVVKPRARN